MNLWHGCLYQVLSGASALHIPIALCIRRMLNDYGKRRQSLLLKGQKEICLPHTASKNVVVSQNTFGEFGIFSAYFTLDFSY